jgi:hypothetical protein
LIAKQNAVVYLLPKQVVVSWDRNPYTKPEDTFKNNNRFKEKWPFLLYDGCVWRPNGLRFSRVACILPESILPANKETHLNHFSPRLATSAAAPGWAFLS